MSQTATKVETNAIMLNGKLVDALMSAINKNIDPVNIPCSKRDAIDQIVNQVGNVLMQNPMYTRYGLGDGTAYKWFGSDMSRRISGSDFLRDKGRFVQACIVYYLSGPEGLRKYCVKAYKVRPRDITDKDRALIEQVQAEIPDAKDVDSSFVPGSGPVDPHM